MTRRRTKDPMGVTGDLFENLEMPSQGEAAASSSPSTLPLLSPSPSPLPVKQNGARDSAAPMLDVLDNWVERGWLRTLDAAFARFLWTEAPHCPPLLLLAAALASHQLGRG